MKFPFTPTPRSRTDLAGIAGAVLGACVGVVALSFVSREYVPFDGIVGPPAIAGFSATRKLWAYFLIAGGATAGGIAAIAAADLFKRRIGRERRSALRADVGSKTRPAIGIPLRIAGIGGVGGAIAIAVALALTAWRAPYELRRAYSPYKFDPAFLFQATVVAGALVRLARAPGVRGPKSRAEASATFAFSAISASSASRFLAVAAPVALHVWLSVHPFVETAALSVPIAIAFGGLFSFVLRAGWARGEADAADGKDVKDGKDPKDETDAKRRAATVAFDRIWVVFAVFPLSILALRLLRVFDPALAAASAWSFLAFGVVAAALVASSLRCRSAGCSPRGAGDDARSLPLLLIPFSAAVLYRGCGGYELVYDPYHQGEYIYAAHALREGLAPFRDVFFVHGFGFNTLPGAVVDGLLGWLDVAPNLDIHFLDLVATACVVLMGFLYLRLWGERWWLLALVLAFCAVGGCATKSSRYAPLFVQAWFVFAFAAKGGAWRAAAAGAVAALGAIWSLDTGATAIVAGAIWFGAFAFARRRVAPFVAYASGGLVPGLAFLAWLASRGLLGEFFDVHATYAAMKRHYDNLPFAQPGLMYFLSPAATVLSAIVLARIAFASVRRTPSGEGKAGGAVLAIRFGIFREGDPLPGALLFFALVNAFSFLRGLDRSDPGHVVYASLFAWPTLGCLAVLRGRSASPQGALVRSFVFVALMCAAPFASRAIRGDALMYIRPDRMFVWYAENSFRPAAAPKSELAARDGFFRFVEEVRAIAGDAPHILDLSNRPALYRWIGSVAPTRFHAAFYAPNLRWQREVVAAIESDETPWILWPSPDDPNYLTDGIDFQIRHREIAAHVLRRYAVGARLADGSVLLKRRGDSDPPPRGPGTANDPALLSGEVDLGAVAALHGARPDPTAVERLIVEFARPVAGTARVEVGSGDRFRPLATFWLRPDGAGPYVVPLGALAGWVWRGEGETARVEAVPADGSPPPEAAWRTEPANP